MLEASQTIMRVAALSFFTAMFAGLWANDRPDGSLALKHQPINDPIARILYGEHEHVPVLQPHKLSKTPLQPVVLSHVSKTEAANKIASVDLRGMSKTFSVEGAELQISTEVLEQHIAQLPLGIAAGDYRIVDSLGGVGWLRVRSSSGIETTHSQQALSTTVELQSVQFIRITQTAMK